MYTTTTSLLKPYIRNVIPAGGAAPLLGHLALALELGRGYALFTQVRG